MKTHRIALAAAVAWLGLVPLAFGQSQIDRTTFSAAVSATDTRVTLAAASGAISGDMLYVDGEAMRLLQNTSGTTWTVRRGENTGATPARGHSTIAPVWVGGGEEFQTSDQSGTCVMTNLRYHPWINTKANKIFDCGANGLWFERESRRNGQANAMSICGGAARCRDSFNQGYSVMQDDGTVKSLLDTEENFVTGSPLGAIEYREEQAKTTSSWVTINGVLDISADDTTASEGVEIIWGATADTGNQLLEIGTNGGCISAMVTVTAIAGVTQFQLGWRQNEAWQDAADYTGYTRWSSVGLTTTDGVIRSRSESSGATQTDSSGQTWVNGTRRAIKSCISAAGTATAYVSDASPDQDAPIYRPITMTNSGLTHTAGQGFIPFMTFLAAGTTDAGITIDWVELETAR